MHEFDGHLGEIEGEISTIMMSTGKETMDRLLQEARMIMTDRRALGMLDNLLDPTESRNHDPINRMDVRPLLTAVLISIDREKEIADRRLLFLLMEEQLADMASLGSCAQGRTVRLLQLYRSMCRPLT